jgi:hypothetical protein
VGELETANPGFAIGGKGSGYTPDSADFPFL